MILILRALSLYLKNVIENKIKSLYLKFYYFNSKNYHIVILLIIKNSYIKGIPKGISYNTGFLIIIFWLNCFIAFSRDNTSFQDSIQNPHYTIPSTSEKIKTDGVLDENFWDDALEIELPYEVEPGENLKAPVKTYVLLSYTKSHLYVGFKAFDPEPSKIRAHYMDRDNAFSDDVVGVILDTYNDERRAFDFMCNPLGIQEDAIETTNSYDESWDAIWESGGRINEQGYFVEMSIPFSSLRFQRGEEVQTWGFDAIRSYPRKVRYHIGTFKRDRNSNCYLCQSLKITGFKGATPGKNIEIVPTLSVKLSQERENETEGNFNWRTKKIDPGLTAKWGITPNMTLGVTVNPDFSQVEADAAQMDINEPFDLFYPEKRPFFTEGSDFFHSDVVYTRTLRDPIWGIKLTGKEKGNTIGSYIVQDKLTNLIFPGSQGNDETTVENESYSSVLRYKRDLGNKYTLGMIYTDREGDDYFNRLGVIDANLRITEKDRIVIQGGLSSTHYPDSIIEQFEQPDGTFNSYAATFNYSHNTRNIDWYLSYEDLGKGLRVDQGFVTQVDYKELEVGANYTWLANNQDLWWTSIEFGGEYEHMVDQSYDLLESGVELDFNISMIKQSHIYVDYSRFREAYNNEEFDQNSFYIHHCAWPIGSLHYWLNFNFGDRIDYDNTRLGKRFRFSPGFDWKIGMHLTLNLNHTYEQLNVEPGRLYTANITEGHITYQFNKQIFLRAILQYRDFKYNVDYYNEDPPEPLEQKVFSQLLFSYKINPQTVLFLGYSDNYTGGEINERDTPLTQTDWAFFFKVGYAFVL